MAEWAARRFWSDAEVAPAGEGHAVLLDGRPIRSPAGRQIVVPGAALAEAVAEEWRAQGEMIDPRTMSRTRAVNSALDKVAEQRDAVIALLSDYARTDLLCYRAEGPEELVAMEGAAWDPLLDWAAVRFGGGARLAVTTGVMPADQPARAISALCAPMRGMDAFTLTAFHDLVALSGSMVIALAVWDGHLTADEGWRRSRIDEEWQASVWGYDEEAQADAGEKRGAFLDAAGMIDLIRA